MDGSAHEQGGHQGHRSGCGSLSRQPVSQLEYDRMILSVGGKGNLITSALLSRSTVLLWGAVVRSDFAMGDTFFGFEVWKGFHVHSRTKSAQTAVKLC